MVLLFCVQWVGMVLGNHGSLGVGLLNVVGSYLLGPAI